MIRLKKIFLIIITVIFVLLFLKTFLSALHEVLNYMGIKNFFSLNLTECKSIFISIVKVAFEFRIFLLSLLALVTIYLGFTRKREWSFNKKSKACFFFGLILLILLNYTVFYYNNLIIEEFKILDKHLIFYIILVAAYIMFILFLILYIFIYFDTKWSISIKLFLIFIIMLVSYIFSSITLSFFFVYGTINDFQVYNEAFSYAINQVLPFIYCMEENLCQEYLLKIYEVCNSSREAQTIPSLRGGPTHARFMRLVVNTLSSLYKIESARQCNNARKDFYDCMQMFKKKK